MTRLDYRRLSVEVGLTERWASRPPTGGDTRCPTIIVGCRTILISPIQKLSSLLATRWVILVSHGRGFAYAPVGRYRIQDRKSTRLNSSHPSISYAVFC